MMIPRAMLEHKPRHGDPCNGCGLCCMATRCQIGRRIYGPGGRCPALRQVGPREYACGVVLALKEGDVMRDAALLLTRAGEGCDARFNGEWTNKDFHAQQNATDARNAEAIAAARKLWEIT